MLNKRYTMIGLACKKIKWAGALMLAGGLLFWAGAVYPPYKQWATNDVKEYLSIIHSCQTNWYIIHGLFVPGVIVSIFGMQLFASSLQTSGANPVFTMIASSAFLLGSIFWILNIAFRITVTVYAAKMVVETGNLPGWFQAWQDWTNILFAIFMVLAYIAIGCVGYAMLYTDILPSWVAWLCTLYGFAAAVLYIVRFPVFEPPLMVYLPINITGLMILVKIKPRDL